MPETRACPAACLVLDDQSTVIEHNGEARRLLGGEALVGRAFASLLSASSRVFLQTQVFPELGMSGRADEIYVTLLASDGRPLSVVLSAQREQSGESFVDLVAFLPVTRQAVGRTALRDAEASAARSLVGAREAHARAAAAEEKLAISDRMATMGMVAASIAHEINNPLAYAMASLELLEASLEEGRPRSESGPLVHEVREGLARIRDVVASVRKLTRVGESRRLDVDLSHVIDAALRMAGAELRQRARVELALASPAPHVLGDEGRLVQVLVNLLVNAAQALRRSPGPHTVRIGLSLEADRAVVTVSDDGPGVPESLRARVFEPLFTTKAIGEGTGLGLAICREIVHSMGGTIELTEARPGATFVLRLPAATRSETSTERAAAPTPGRAPLSGRVMLVEDDPAVARAVSRALSGCEVVSFSSGTEALESLRRGSSFDVALCDLMMPQMSGMELYAALEEQWPSLAEQTLFLTGGAFTDETSEFLQRIGRRAVHKPFTVRGLRDVVAERLARRPTAG